MAKSIKEEEAEKVLHSDAFVGRIIRLASAAESRLDIHLAFYFSRGASIQDFVLLIGERLSFSAKIEILSKLTLPKKGKSYTTLLRILRGLCYLRNKLAHDYYITGVKLTKITDNADAMLFVTANRREQGRLKSQMEVCFHHVWSSIEKSNAERA